MSEIEITVRISATKAQRLLRFLSEVESEASEPAGMSAPISQPPDSPGPSLRVASLSSHNVERSEHSKRDVDTISGNHDETGTTIKFETGPEVHLRYLLNDKPLQQIVRLVVSKRGQFLNKELAEELGVDIQQTFPYLGRVTRVLRKAGIRAEGAQGINWYRKTRTSSGTLITVRADVLDLFQSFK